jgi:uncharacterized protein (PEP-CTERM system associated)
MISERLARGAGACLVLLPFSASVLAQEEIAFWQFTPRASIAQIYSDNIDQAPRGEENSEPVTDLNVGFRLNRDGPRGSGRFDYNLQGVAFWDESDANEVFQQFTGAGDVALAPERVFVEGSVDFRQRAVDRDGSLSDNLTLDAERTDVLSLRLSPYLIQRFEDAAIGELRYAYSRVDYGSEADDEVDSETNRLLATLDSGPMFGRIGWGLSYDYSKEDFDDGSSFESQVVEALGRWETTERSSVFAVVGYEDNEFELDPSLSSPDGFLWRIGATYQPAARTFVEGFFGERYSDSTYGLEMRHQVRTGQLFASYREELTTTNDDEFELRPIRDEFGDPVFDPATGNPLFEEPDLTTNVYLSQRFSAGFRGRLTKTDWGVRLYNDRREFQSDGRSERVTGVAGNLALRLAPRTSLGLNARWEESTFADQPDREDEIIRVGLALRRDLGRGADASLEYSYRERESTIENQEFKENRITATLTKVF